MPLGETSPEDRLEEPLGKPTRLSRLPTFLRDLVNSEESEPAGAQKARSAQARHRLGKSSSTDPRSNKEATEDIEPRSLFGEILDWMYVPLVLIWPMSITITFLVARSLSDTPFDKILLEKTESLSQQVRIQGNQAVVNLSVSAQDASLSDDQRANQLFQITDPAGIVVAGDRKIPPPPIYDFPDSGAAKLRFAQIEGIEFRVAYVYKQSSSKDSDGPQILIQVAETLDGRNALANEIVKGVIFPQFVTLPITIWLVWFGLNRGLTPLRRLEQRLRQRAPDDLSEVDLAGTPEEIMPLMRSFNELLAKLGHNISGQKRFIADAAHQMKTPLAGLKTQAELALRQTEPEELRKSLSQVVQSSDRAAHLISQLLSLARTENLQDSGDTTAIELTSLTQSVLQELAPTAIAKNIDLGFEPSSDRLYVNGQHLLLHELIQNLVDNALRYTPSNGIITVRVLQLEDRILLEVEDNGPGVPEEQRHQVFDRFFQGNNAPNKVTSQGSGLGLAIVAEIARQHQAKIWVEPGIQRPPNVEQGESDTANAYGARFVLSMARRKARASDF
jgi:two-component system, OmpR family, sensor histidine kinase TctE